VHFGQGDFTGKYRTLVENFTQWQANAGAPCTRLIFGIRGRWWLNPDIQRTCGKSKIESRRAVLGKEGQTI